MLVDPPIEKLNENTACAYELAVLVAQRACQLVDGAQPMIPDEAANMVSLACKEIAAGKVKVVQGEHADEVKVPITRAERERRAAAKKSKEEQESFKKYTASVDEAVQQSEAEKPSDVDNTLIFDTVTEGDTEADLFTDDDDEE